MCGRPSPTMAPTSWDFSGRRRAGRCRAVLETALEQVSQAPTRVVGSGRTDTGVHAAGQVIGFWTTWRHSLADLQRALNAVLPGDVAVLTIGPADPTWHPRFSATRRYYRYTVLNQPWRSPLERRYAHLVTQPLNLEAMQAAADLLVGVHDFASFGQPTQGDSTVREHLQRRVAAGWLPLLLRRDRQRLLARHDALSGGDALTGWHRASGRSTGWQTCWQARNRALAPPPAPACGLCLMQVDYE